MEKYKICKVENNIFSLEEAKNYLRISHDHDNDMIIGIIDASVSYAENFTGLCFAKKDIEFEINGLHSQIKLRYFPILEIEELNVIGCEIKEDSYTINMYNGFIRFANELIECKAKIRYVAGHDKVPADVKNAMLIYAANLYDSYTIPKSPLDVINNIYMRYRILKI